MQRRSANTTEVDEAENVNATNASDDNDEGDGDLVAVADAINNPPLRVSDTTTLVGGMS